MRVDEKANKVVDKQALRQKMVDKWSIKPSLAGKLVDILIFWPIKNKSLRKILSVTLVSIPLQPSAICAS